PAADTRVSACIAGVAAFSGELRPAGFSARIRHRALPRRAGEVRQRGKRLQALRRLIIFADSIAPLRFANGWRQWRWITLGNLDEPKRGRDLSLRRVPLIERAMKFLHALLGRLASGTLGQSFGAGRGEISVQEKQRLLRNGGLVAHRDVDVR